MSERAREILERLAKDLDADSPSAAPPWVCAKCDQTNAGWARECGRCEAVRMPAEEPLGPPDRPALEDPADSRPCGCEEVEGLKEKLAETERARDWAARDVVSLEKRLAEATALLTRWKSDEPIGGIAERKLHHDTSEFLWPSVTPAPAAPCPAWPSQDCVMLGCPGSEEDDESLIEQLDEALCTLLHKGDEVGEHSPRTHLDLFYARNAAPAAMCRADVGGSPCGEQEPCDEHPSPEPWRVGTRVPEHVYIGDRPLVTMPTAELAALVVTAVNGEAVTALRACQQKMAEALEELNETRWGFSGGGGSMNSWGETIEGRTFKRVDRAREILKR